MLQKAFGDERAPDGGDKGKLDKAGAGILVMCQRMMRA